MAGWGRALAAMSLAAVLAGCGWNPGFGTGDTSKVGPYAGGLTQGGTQGNGTGSNTSRPSTGGTPATGGTGAPGGTNGSTTRPGQTTTPPTGNGGQTGGTAPGGSQTGGAAPGGSQGGATAPRGLPAGTEKIQQRVYFKNDLSVTFETATVGEGGLEIQGSARDETSARDLARIDMIVRVYDSQGSYPGQAADLGSASVGNLKFRLGFQVPREQRYVILLDGLRVLRTPQNPVIPLSRSAPLPGGGSIVSYETDDSFNRIVRIITPSDTHYRIQLQWNDGRTFLPTDERATGTSGGRTTWELYFTNTPTEGRPAALQIPEYTRDYLNLDQVVRD